MSALGQKQTLEGASGMSALRPRADIGEAVGDQQLCRLSPLPQIRPSPAHRHAVGLARVARLEERDRAVVRRRVGHLGD
jgi:hypothetical protein